MAKDAKTQNSSNEKKQPTMIQVMCGGKLHWANHAPKSNGYRCTKCGKVHS